MARLNYHHLHYFWCVARDGNLTRSAQRLHVSQSALSMQIRQLEEMIGEQLFSRTGRSLVLTETGQIVLRYANSIFRHGEELENFHTRRLAITAAAAAHRRCFHPVAQLC